MHMRDEQSKVYKELRAEELKNGRSSKKVIVK